MHYKEEKIKGALKFKCTTRVIKPTFSYFSEDRATTNAWPDDVMQGYFAVVAIKGEESKRFIVRLEYLSDPAFLELLDQAGEEYGFRQQGALTLPCRPQELQKILDAPKQRAGNI
ncbi:hypothetical protein Fmac_027612 [Flemingia macrophylla]|uniref:Small auxin up regulated protein n=1 Tax=Flemingia macrophylla TaxID=520843 RepID=A0ABD1LI77_9FABA